MCSLRRSETQHHTSILSLKYKKKKESANKGPAFQQTRRLGYCCVTAPGHQQERKGYIKRWLYAELFPGELSSATISSMHNSVHPPKNEDQSSEDDMGWPWGRAIRNSHTRSSFSLWSVFANEQLRVPVDPKVFSRATLQ